METRKKRDTSCDDAFVREARERGQGKQMHDMFVRQSCFDMARGVGVDSGLRTSILVIPRMLSYVQLSRLCLQFQTK